MTLRRRPVAAPHPSRARPDPSIEQGHERMSLVTHKIAPCLWFDSEAEQAANFYVSVFKNSKIDLVSRYGNEGVEIHGREPGSVMTVAFELDGQPFVALNGGPIFTFDEAVSFQIYCADQNEIDYYWT